MDDDDSDAGLRVASNHIHNKGIVRHFDGARALFCCARPVPSIERGAYQL